MKIGIISNLDPNKRGYINATAIAKQFGREPIHWLRNNNVQAYIASLIKRINDRSANSHTETKSISYDDLVIVVNGGPIGTYGTWLHPKLGVIFARWLTPDFAVWCDEQIAWLMHQHPAYQQQFPELSQIFDKMNGEFQQHRWENNQRLYALARRYD